MMQAWKTKSSRGRTDIGGNI